MVQTPSIVVLVVDDDQSILKLVRLQLQDEGFRAITASTGREAIDRVQEARPDLVVLDLMLPDMSGFEVFAAIREYAPIPTIMLTARSRDDDKVRGLEMGADDYLAKPFSPDELTARIRAVLRRARQQEGTSPDSQVAVGDLSIDLERRTVHRTEALVPLTRTEWSLLEVLVRNRGKVLMNHEVLGKVWGPEYVNDLQYLRVWISRLRRKLEPDRPTDSIIQTFPGMGYMFRDVPQTPASLGADAPKSA
jgi:two-component system, OmpR family, KDP operon response regulator KdpE